MAAILAGRNRADPLMRQHELASSAMAARTDSNLFSHACSLLESVLAGPTRREILESVSVAPDLGGNLLRLRDGMATHVWRAGNRTFNLHNVVSALDTRTRREGLHAMHDWDGIADDVNPDMIAIDVLNYIADIRGNESSNRVVLSILLDYYFMYLLALLSLRLWDDGDADENLDRLEELLGMLQGEHGSSQPFAGDAETLILIATSHYELSEDGYHLLLERTRTLSVPHQTRVAIGHAPCLGSHLRFGFEATYGRDTVNMRNDNIADYPWLCFSLATLMREYVRLRRENIEGVERAVIVEALLNGVGGAPGFLSRWEAELAEFRSDFTRFSADLLTEFERFRPMLDSYSPMSFFFNFSHNVLKGTVIDALLAGEPWPLTINDLTTSIDLGPAHAKKKEALARTLMAYARANPHKIRGKLTPVIVYDPQAGRQAYSVTIRKLTA
jgi:hypothetical protein